MVGSVNLSRWSFLLISLVSWTVESVVALEFNERCVNTIGGRGKCIFYMECPKLIYHFIHRLNLLEHRRFISRSRCGTLQEQPLVCCPEYSHPSTLPEPPYCGMQLSDFAVSGQSKEIVEFPWMALIEYQKSDGSFGFFCGGTLINERYIVTAAHCIKSIPPSWKVHRVRLGEWDLASANDCQGGFCSKKPIDLDIAKIVVHENYDPMDQSNENDIALIRFTRSVDSSSTVAPICLPLSASLRNRDHVGQASYTAGWHKPATKKPDEMKLKNEVNITSLQECASDYQSAGIMLNSTHMCARSMEVNATCSGDSGGPLMRRLDHRWYLIGVVSFGPENCETADVPSVYTNVAKYVDWIKDNIY